MGSGHSHGSAAAAHRGRLLVVLGLTTVVLISQVVGASITNSLALLADAGHMLTDVAGIGLAVLAVSFAAKPATPQRTFGYYRLEIFAAVINAVLLLTVAIFIFGEAWQRWNEPPDVAGGLMLGFAVVGLAANLAGMWILRSGAKESLNVRGAYLEVLGDALGSLAVIAAAIVIATTGWERADVVASVLVCLMILPRTWSLLREAVEVLLQATPRGMDLEVVRQHILGVPGVTDAHDLHAWTLTSGMPVLSVHVVVSDEVTASGRGGTVLEQIRCCMADHFDVAHCTIQIEPRGHESQEAQLHA